MATWVVVGLGNPGPQYAWNRHNLGFMAVDAFAEAHGLGTSQFKTSHQALVQKLNIVGNDIHLVKPMTFMNRSGTPVRELLAYYKLGLSNLLVIHDEVEVSFGHLKFQSSRGHGGHNGIRDLHEQLGSNQYFRLRLGVGRPIHPNMNLADYLLSNFSSDEQQELGSWLATITDAIHAFIQFGYERAATQFNKRN